MMQSQNWQWLAKTFWYVPEDSLPAPQFDPEGGPPVWLVDQTVWQIQAYEKGYFWGNCAALLYEPGEKGETPRGLRLAGSITPQGDVHITFMPESPLGASQATIGLGRMVWREGAWSFEMQMSSGMGDVVLHWAFMLQCKPGYPAWQELPGTSYSVPDFLRAAGFNDGP